MLEIKNITKSYTKDRKILKNVNIKFRKKEFVSILGSSGSGKTTLLNILGGIDNSFEGELNVYDANIKKFKDKDLDYYRNNYIGFIFQNNNLINNLTCYENVCIPLRIANKKINRDKIEDLFKKFSILHIIDKNPSKISGGEKSRVSIIRAIILDTKILLCDEPTGALDSKTSEEVLEILKSISKEKLVIMVTHNKKQAYKYSDRIITLKDGQIESDSKPFNEIIKEEYIKKRKKKINLITKIKLSTNNLLSKKKRTILTVLASSIGIIGISLLLSLKYGFNNYINNFEKQNISSFPIFISQETTKEQKTQEKDKNKIYSYNTYNETTHYNDINHEYIEYIKNIDENDLYSIKYTYKYNFNVLDSNKEKVYLNLNSLSNNNDMYTLIEGKFPSEYNEVVVMIDSNNYLEENILKALNINDEHIEYNKIIKREINIVLNKDYYIKNNNIFIEKSNHENYIPLKIVGIIKEKNQNIINSLYETFNNTKGGIYYTDSLIDYLISKENKSDIINFQKQENYNILTKEKINNIDKKTILTNLGNDKLPYAISIYPKNVSSKQKILSYLSNYQEQIIYQDTSKDITQAVSEIINVVSIILIAFSSISLIVTIIMIGIITYISVLERTKEIGILRILGTSKNDVSKIFITENITIGILSGLTGLFISKLLLEFINTILKQVLDIDNLLIMNKNNIFYMILISTCICLIGGLIPSKKASKHTYNSLISD